MVSYWQSTVAAFLLLTISIGCQTTEYAAHVAVPADSQEFCPNLHPDRRCKYAARSGERAAYRMMLLRLRTQVGQ